jgi:hypothetical protein
MSLDIALHVEKVVAEEVFGRNLTHNLTTMALEAGVYWAIWRPNEAGLHTAGELIPFLVAGLVLLRTQPNKFKEFEPGNGWGTLEHFEQFVDELLAACRLDPDAEISVSR